MSSWLGDYLKFSSLDRLPPPVFGGYMYSVDACSAVAPAVQAAHKILKVDGTCLDPMISADGHGVTM